MEFFAVIAKLLAEYGLPGAVVLFAMGEVYVVIRAFAQGVVVWGVTHAETKASCVEAKADLVRQLVEMTNDRNWHRDRLYTIAGLGEQIVKDG